MQMPPNPGGRQSMMYVYIRAMDETNPAAPPYPVRLRMTPDGGLSMDNGELLTPRQLEDCVPDIPQARDTAHWRVDARVRMTALLLVDRALHDIMAVRRASCAIHGIRDHANPKAVAEIGAADEQAGDRAALDTPGHPPMIGALELAQRSWLADAERRPMRHGRARMKGHTFYGRVVGVPAVVLQPHGLEPYADVALVDSHNWPLVMRIGGLDALGSSLAECLRAVTAAFPSMLRVILPNPVVHIERATERMLAIVHTSVSPGKERHIAMGMGGLPTYDVEHSARVVDQGLRLMQRVYGRVQDAPADWAAFHHGIADYAMSALVEMYDDKFVETLIAVAAGLLHLRHFELGLAWAVAATRLGIGAPYAQYLAAVACHNLRRHAAALALLRQARGTVVTEQEVVRSEDMSALLRASLRQLHAANSDAWTHVRTTHDVFGVDFQAHLQRPLTEVLLSVLDRSGHHRIAETLDSAAVEKACAARNMRTPAELVAAAAAAQRGGKRVRAMSLNSTAVCMVICKYNLYGASPGLYMNELLQARCALRACRDWGLDQRAAALDTVQDCVAFCILTIQAREPETLPRLARATIRDYVADAETRALAEQDLAWHAQLIKEGQLPKYERGLSKMKRFEVPLGHEPVWEVGTVQGGGSSSGSAGRSHHRSAHVRVQADQLD